MTDKPNDGIEALALLVGPRPFAQSDIEHIHPQAAVDKTFEGLEPVSLAEVRAKPNASVVEMFEDLLAKAKSGEISAMAACTVLRGRSTMTYVSAGNDYHMLNSAAARLAAQLANDPGEDMLEDET